MDTRSPPIRIAEARALEAARGIAGNRILCTTLGRAQASHALALERPSAQIACWFLDEHQQLVAAAACGPTANLSLDVLADAPVGAVDLAVMPLATRGVAELARDVLQSAWLRLVPGGTLVTAVDNPADRWVREQVGAWFDKVRVLAHDDATVYVARKDAAPRKVRNFRCEFAFRDEGRLLRAVTRPGVFSHRRVDPGARHLMTVAAVRPGARVLDLGCGSGVVGIALAAREPSAAVVAVDSHARAVECTAAGAALNALTNVTAELNSTGTLARPGEFDLAVLNPPYYGDFAIAERFLDTAFAALKPGGDVLVVTKAPDWCRTFLQSRWLDIEMTERKSYWIVSAVKARN